MRKIILCFAAIGSMAIMGAVAACSSDDSTTTDGGTADSGTPDTYVPPVDSGKKDSGGTDAGPCSTCGELLNGTGSLSNACDGTLNKAFAVIACACFASPAGGTGQGKCDVDSGTAADGGGACTAFCASPTTTLPNAECQGCGNTNCHTELTACITDGTDAGAGDGGDGG